VVVGELISRYAGGATIDVEVDLARVSTIFPLPLLPPLPVAMLAKAATVDPDPISIGEIA
jgi:hypothetical protein